jgi:hypothetical protein
VIVDLGHEPDSIAGGAGDDDRSGVGEEHKTPLDAKESVMERRIMRRPFTGIFERKYMLLSIEYSGECLG